MIWLAAAMIARTLRGAPRGIAARPSVRTRAVEPKAGAVVTSGIAARPSVRTRAVEPKAVAVVTSGIAGTAVVVSAAPIGAGASTGVAAGAGVATGAGKRSCGSAAGSPGKVMPAMEASAPPAAGRWAGAGALTARARDAPQQGTRRRLAPRNPPGPRGPPTGGGRTGAPRSS